MRVVIGSMLAAVLAAPLAFAQAPPPAPPAPATQSSPDTWNGLPDRFQIDTGYFRLTASSLLRFNGPQCGGGEVNLEQDLGVAGLRKAKLSYHPHHMVEKYVASVTL